MTEHTPERTSIISNILAVAGFIILIAIVVWGAFHFLNIASSGFSSLFNRTSTSAIPITLSQRSVASGQPLDISWKYSAPTVGSFALVYQCRTGFQFRSVSTAGIVTDLPCGAAQTIGDGNTKNQRLVPVLTGTSPVDVQLSLLFQQSSAMGSSTPVSSTKAQGNATVTITPSASGTAVTAGTATSQPATQPAVPPEKPDLVVRILAIGVIDPYSGALVNRLPTSDNDVVAVKFDIANLGGPSGAWYFTAQLPTLPATPYISPQQKSLGKGDHIENTLRFNRVMSGGGIFSVSVDPSNIVQETNESNNYASQSVSDAHYQPYPQLYIY